MKFYRRIAAIKAMSFDLDDTLYDNHPVIMRMEQALLSWLKQMHPAVAHMDAGDWLAVKKRVVQAQPELKHDVTLWRMAQLEQAFLFAGYSVEDAQQAAQAGVEEVLKWRSDFVVPPSSLAVLAKLASVMPLVAITNGNVDLERIGLAPYFDLVLKAGPDGRAKPEPDLFAKAQHFLDLPAKHILHVGDHLQTDVLGAKRAGFSACWLNHTSHSLFTHQKGLVLPDIEIQQLNSLCELLE